MVGGKRGLNARWPKISHLRRDEVKVGYAVDFMKEL